jgi:hypothetical protein
MAESYEKVDKIKYTAMSNYVRSIGNMVYSKGGENV